MRLAAIDIGTNSIHMIVVNVRADLSFEVIDQEKAMVRLGAGGLDGRMLTTEAMTAGLQALSKFRRLAESHGVEKVLATATSAVREAKNGGDFLGRIASSTGIRARVISGIEEARLIHLAAMYGVDVGSARAVVIDIGGGSVEITHGSVDRGAGLEELQAWRDPAHRALRPDRSALPSGRAEAREAHPRRDRPALRGDHQRRVRSRHRYVWHDPEHRRRRGNRGTRDPANGGPEPARAEQADSWSTQADGRYGAQ